MKDCKNFFTKIEELKLYKMEFEEDNIIIPKAYPSNYTVQRDEHQFIIVITHDKYIFFTNNRVWKVWTQKKDIFLQPKSWDQDIITFKFFLFYG